MADFCLVDDRLKAHRIRQRGPSPKLLDTEILAVEIVGEFLGIDTGKDIHLFFRRHCGGWFSALSKVYWNTFARQRLTLWKLKERRWQSRRRS